MKVRHPEYVLAATTGVCLPMVPGLLSGQITAVSGAERFLAALIVCWFLGAVLSWVLTTYSEQVRRSQVMRMVETDRGEAPGDPSGPVPAE